jgi:hypothetical protein
LAALALLFGLAVVFAVFFGFAVDFAMVAILL